MNIFDYFTGKNIFLTGGAGSLGKSFLETILRTCPNVGKIYLLLRGKKDSSSQDRLNKDIISSNIFDMMRSQNPNFEAWINSKLVPLDGDVSKERLGLSDKDYNEVTSNAHIFISNAASTSFKTNIVETIYTNTLSVMETLKIAKNSNLEHFVHISTAGTHWERKNHEQPFEEIMYDIEGIDPDSYIEFIKNLKDKDLIEAETIKINKKYGTCYTFSKSLAEVLLYKSKDNLPLTIIRCPSIGPALLHPFPGYTDVAKAFAGNYLYFSLDKTQACLVSDTRKMKELPLDIFSNYLVVSMAKLAKTNQTNIINSLCDTSMTLKEALTIARDYYYSQRPSVRAPKLFTDKKAYEEFIKELLANAKTEEEKNKVKRTIYFNEISYLVNIKSQSDMVRNQSLSLMMSEEEKKIFPIDFKLTPDYIKLACWGVDTYYLKNKAAPVPRPKL